MENTNILNAQITNTKLGEECGCFTADLTIEGDGFGCWFGGYCLDSWFAEIGHIMEDKWFSFKDYFYTITTSNHSKENDD